MFGVSKRDEAETYDFRRDDELELEALGRAAERAGDWLVWLAVLCALGWLAGAASLAAWGLDGVDLTATPPALAIACLAAALTPALLILFAGSAAREGARARAEARRLALAAERLLSPAPAAEAAARRLGVSVRGEIAALDRSVEHALSRFRELDGVVARQTEAMEGAFETARVGAGDLTQHLDRERAALLAIGDGLSEQAQLIGDQISRHTRAIVEAAQIAESEIQAADEALDSRLSSFAAAAALISDRTASLNLAAKASADSALRLETALSTALDALAKATNLTDAAWQNSEHAAQAANATASAVRETTARAIEEARRAAEMIRAEAAAFERDAQVAIGRVRAGAAEPPAAPAPAPAPRPIERSTKFDPPEPRRTSLGESLAGAERGPNRQPEGEPASLSGGGRWTWRHMLAAIDEERARPKRASEAEPSAEFEPAPGDTAIAARNLSGSARILARVGLRLEDVFSVGAIDRIAKAARNGSQARRRAVREAAAPAVMMLAQLLDADRAARAEVEGLLRGEGDRIGELLARGRAPMSAEATRLFLLLDAAAH